MRKDFLDGFDEATKAENTESTNDNNNTPSIADSVRGKGIINAPKYSSGGSGGNNGGRPGGNRRNNRDNNGDEFGGVKRKVKIGVVLVIAVIAIAVIATMSVKTVDTGTVGIKKVWGAVDAVRNDKGEVVSYKPPLQPGIHFIIPFAEEIIPVETRTQVYSVTLAGASKDIQNVNAATALSYHISAESAPELYDKVGLNVGDRLFAPALQGLGKTMLPRYTAEEIVQKRPALVADIDTEVHTRLDGRGIVIEHIDVTDVQFEKAFTDSIEQKVIAAQNALKADNEVNIAKAEAQKQIAQAEGQKQAAILAAQGQAESIKIINEQLQNSPHYTEYLKTTKWDGKLPYVVGGNGATPFINLQDLQSAQTATASSSTSSASNTNSTTSTG